jgi:hypothetical protein
MWKLRNAGGTCTPEGVYTVDPPTFTSESETESAGTLNEGDWYEVWVATDAVDLSVRHVSVLGHSGDQSYLLNATLDQVDDDPFYDPDGDGYQELDGDGPAIVAPDMESRGPLVLLNGEHRTIGPGVFMYDYIDQKNGSVLSLAGDTTLWILKSITIRESAVCNPPADNQRLVIYIPPDTAVSQNIVVHNSAILNAFIYAPNSTLTLKNYASLYGSFVVDDLTTYGPYSTNYSEEATEIPWPSTATVDYYLIGYGE